MSYFNVGKISEDSAEQLGLTTLVHDLNGTRCLTSFRDGEELMAAAELVKLLSELKNGELIVVGVDYF